MGLGTLIAATVLILLGVAAIFFAGFLGLSGLDLLIAPVSIGLGLALLFIGAGGSNPWGVLGIFAGTELAFVLVAVFDVAGLGGAV
jgi:hypothetical protein